MVQVPDYRRIGNGHLPTVCLNCPTRSPAVWGQGYFSTNVLFKSRGSLQMNRKKYDEVHGFLRAPHGDLPPTGTFDGHASSTHVADIAESDLISPRLKAAGSLREDPHRAGHNAYQGTTRTPSPSRTKAVTNTNIRSEICKTIPCPIVIIILVSSMIMNNAQPTMELKILNPFPRPQHGLFFPGRTNANGNRS